MDRAHSARPTGRKVEAELRFDFRLGPFGVAGANPAQGAGTDLIEELGTGEELLAGVEGGGASGPSSADRFVELGADRLRRHGKVSLD
ncbi:MAG: hypothetical protein ACKOEM_09635 [Planctomycetia bacterium]